MKGLACHDATSSGSQVGQKPVQLLDVRIDPGTLTTPLSRWLKVRLQRRPVAVPTQTTVSSSSHSPRAASLRAAATETAAEGARQSPSRPSFTRASVISPSSTAIAPPFDSRTAQMP